MNKIFDFFLLQIINYNFQSGQFIIILLFEFHEKFKSIFFFFSREKKF